MASQLKNTEKIWVPKYPDIYPNDLMVYLIYGSGYAVAYPATP